MMKCFAGVMYLDFSVDGAFYDGGRGKLAGGLFFLEEEEEWFESELLIEVFRKHA